MVTEAQIHDDIEGLRARISDTQELYREVCAILFFRYGITPTANKLYQYVRKGSMSAPAEALAKFWEELREKSRVRIEHPDLPDALKSAAGELVAALWTQAQSAAHDGLEIFRSEIQAAMMEAHSAQALAETERTATLMERDQAHQAAKTAADRALQLERDLAAERAGKAAYSTQLENAGRQQAVLEAALVEARRDFATELDKHRQALERSEERWRAAEKRALLEVDRERTSAAKLQKDLAQSHQRHQDAEERHRTELAKLQTELGEARQKWALAEGMLHELRTRCQQQTDELILSRTTVAESDARKDLLEHELAACRKNAVKLQRQLQELATPVAPEGESNKPRKSRRRAVA